MSSRALKLTLEPSRYDPTSRFRLGGTELEEDPDDAESSRPAVEAEFGRWMDRVRHLGSDKVWTAKHFRCMQQVLDQVTAGTVRRVFFQIPIRHGKSEHNTIGYSAYRLERDPRTRILICSYNQTQANTFSRSIQSLARTREIRITKDAAAEWETTAGGGVRAVGAGAGLASVNAGLIVIDDPIGSRDDAESLAHRDMVWDWLTNDVLARCDPRTAVLFTMSRWHQDDPAGRLRDRQGAKWTVIDLPAAAEVDDPLGRAMDEPLWVEERNAAWLEEKRVELGAYGFASLLQGRPRPREGGMFKWTWWKLIETVPAVGAMVRYWDLAGTLPRGGLHDPDYTVGALGCRMVDQRTAIVDIERFRKSIAERDARLVEVARADLKAYPGRIRWWIETEAGIAGGERTAELVRRLQAVGMAVSCEHPTGKKVHRAEPLASKAEAGNVVLCPGAWRDDFRSEAADFPHGRHDDQIDAASGADTKLSSSLPWTQTKVTY
jgi:predicted phage terminase large subunit-like protein